MADLIIFLAGGLTVAVVYLIATTQRHERALQYFEEQLQRRERVATWEDLDGGDD